jgi:hypothetical protein
MNPLLLLGLAIGALWLYSGSASATPRTYPLLGAKYFPAKAGDRIMLTAQITSRVWNDAMSTAVEESFKNLAPTTATVEGFASTPIPNGMKFSAIVLYAIDYNIPLGRLDAPLQVPAPGGSTLEPSTMVFISAKNVVTGQEVSV